ncbi:MAG: hypothetical protein H6752_09625 [Candidatus Omnitrophica bacterium]|nr:hypothetical protein [Candidatus Omnitrophota bacterium]
MPICRTIILIALLPLTAWPATLHVSPHGDGTNGLSWETAFSTPQAAMVVAASGDSVWVRSATYLGRSSRWRQVFLSLWRFLREPNLWKSFSSRLEEQFTHVKWGILVIHGSRQDSHRWIHR